MALSVRHKTATQFRNAVVSREDAAVRFLAKRWEVSMKRLQRDIDAITRKIDKARLAGDPVNRDWLRRQQEWKRLQSQIIREANQYSAVVAGRLREETEWAARKGAEKSLQLSQLSLAEPLREVVTFRALSDDVILEIAGRVHPRSPTGKILGRLGRETAKKARDVLVDGITRGRNVRVIARELQTAANLPKSRALTIARTEIFGAYTDASQRHMQRNKDVVEKWVWNCSLGTACGGCLAEHGKTFEVDTFMKKHPNCHCEPIPVSRSWKDLGIDLPEDFFENVNPASLDVDEEVNGFDPEKMRSDALAQIKGRPLPELQARFGIEKGKLIHSGKVKLDDLSMVTESKIWGGATVETPLKYLMK